MSEERLLILKMLAGGKITPEQADQLLEALESGVASTGEASRPQEEKIRAEKKKVEDLSDEERRERRQARIAAARERLERMQEKLEAAREHLDERMEGVQERLEEAQQHLEEMQVELEHLSKEGRAEEDPFRVVSDVLKDVDPGRIVREVLRDVDPGRIVREVMEGLSEEMKEARRSWKQGKRWSFDFGRAFEGFGKGLMGGVTIENTANLPEHTEEFHAAFTARPGLIFCMKNPLGDIAVRPGTGQLSVRAIKRAWAYEPEEAARMAERISFISHESPEEAELIVETADQIRNVRVDVEIEVPEGVGVRLDTAAGKLTLEGIRGPVQGATLSGEIAARQLKGAVSLDSKSGNILVQDVEGDLEAESLSGDLKVERVAPGRVVLKTKSGNIQTSEVACLEIGTMSGDVIADRVHGEASLRSMSGDVLLRGGEKQVNLATTSGDIRAEGLRAQEVRFTTVSGDASLQFEIAFSGRLEGSTVSGDVNIGLPVESSFQIELRSQSGEVECHLPLTQVERGGHRLAGKAGNGEGRIEVKTTSGDIRAHNWKGGDWNE